MHSIAMLGPAGPASQAATDHSRKPHERAYDLPGHPSIGSPPEGTSATETIEISITETASGAMLFSPDAIYIEKDTTVRFVINNTGALDHEFFLGAFDEIAKHQQWMRSRPNMPHADANAIRVPSGAQATLVWRFSSMTNLEFACLFPGHREMGMWGVIIVHDHLAPQQKS